MKHFLITTALVVAAVTTPALAADVGVSVTIGQPGFYGRIDIGDYPYPHPRVIYRQPRIIERVYIEREPIYMRVPPGHAKNWRKHCRKYDACGERVYFVQDSWYRHEYVPTYQEYHHERRDDRWDDRREHEDARRDDRKDDYHGDRRNEGPGNSQGHSNNGHGKNKGHGQNR